MDYDYNTPPSEQFQSFANSVLEAARVSSVALGVRVNENTIGTQSETLSGTPSSLTVLLLTLRWNNFSTLVLFTLASANERFLGA